MVNTLLNFVEHEIPIENVDEYIPKIAYLSLQLTTIILHQFVLKLLPFIAYAIM